MEKMKELKERQERDQRELLKSKSRGNLGLTERFLILKLKRFC